MFTKNLVKCYYNTFHSDAEVQKKFITTCFPTKTIGLGFKMTVCLFYKDAEDFCLKKLKVLKQKNILNAQKFECNGSFS